MIFHYLKNHLHMVAGSPREHQIQTPLVSFPEKVVKFNINIYLETNKIKKVKCVLSVLKVDEN